MIRLLWWFSSSVFLGIAVVFGNFFFFINGGQFSRGMQGKYVLE